MKKVYKKENTNMYGMKTNYYEWQRFNFLSGNFVEEYHNKVHKTGRKQR